MKATLEIDIYRVPGYHALNLEMFILWFLQSKIFYLLWSKVHWERYESEEITLVIVTQPDVPTSPEARRNFSETISKHNMQWAI